MHGSRSLLAHCLGRPEFGLRIDAQLRRRVTILVIFAISGTRVRQLARRRVRRVRISVFVLHSLAYTEPEYVLIALKIISDETLISANGEMLALESEIKI